MQERRPSERELHKKIEEAKEFLKHSRGLFANPSKAVGELYELNVGAAQEVWPLIGQLLEEIKPSDYAGCNPPQKSYEKLIEGVELFAFRWFSEKCGEEMYLKFALKNGYYYYLSLHVNRAKGVRV